LPGFLQVELKSSHGPSVDLSMLKN